MNKKFLKKLPQIHQNDVQKKFFDATFEQLFSKKQSKKFDGFIGRRVSGVFDLEKDYYLPEIDKARTWYQLEPASFTRDLFTGDKQNVNFYTDLVNRLKYYGGNVGNHDRLFSGEYYTYAPPIDVDKFVNYQNYIWIPIRLLPVELFGIDDTYITSHIVGKKNFEIEIDGDVMRFASGMRVTFPNSNSFREHFTVEGVGASIRLVADLNEVLSARRYQPLPWDDDATISGLALDNREWDNNMWDAIDIGALLRDYITIERGARDANMWSRTNKWIHRSALEATIKFSKQSFPSFSVRAERPIIEFRRDIELFNFGNQHRIDVDAVTGDASISHNLSGLSMEDATGLGFLEIRDYSELALLSNGSLIVFMSDESIDPRTGIPVNRTVYRTSFEQTQTARFDPTDITISEGENILVKGGNTRSLGGNIGYYYHMINGVWTESSNSKRSANQPPLFNAYDSDAYPLNDELRYVNSTFSGTPIFGYSVDRSPGARNDRELGFPIRYRSTRQGSEIVFENFLETRKYSYISSEGVVTYGEYQYYRNVLSDDQLFDRSRWDFENGWSLGKNSSRQHVVYKYPVSIDGTYRIDTMPHNNDIDNISVVSDGKAVLRGAISLFSKNLDNYVRVDGLAYGEGHDVEIRIYTHDILPANSNGFFEIPAQLEANPTQFEVSEITYGEIVPHFNTIIMNQPEYTGNVVRENNYLNSSRDLSLGTRIIQSKTPMIKSMLVTSNEEIDLVESMRFAGRAYTIFKQQFVRNIEAAIDEYPDMGSYIDVKKWVDNAIIASTEQWVDTGAFANSNMYPIGDPSAMYDVNVLDVAETVTLTDISAGVEYRITDFDASSVLKRDYRISVNDGLSELVSGQDVYLTKADGFLILKFTSDYSEVNVTITTYEADLILPFKATDHNNMVFCYSAVDTGARSVVKKLLIPGVDYSYFVDGPITRIIMHGNKYTRVIVNAYERFISANIPASPSMLGITKLYQPSFMIDDTGIESRLILVGHDGSKITMYTDPSKISEVSGAYISDSNGVPVPNGLSSSDVLDNHASVLARFFDIRDIALYFYEVAAFSNVSDRLRYDHVGVLDFSTLVNSAYRSSRYSTSEMSKILTPGLSRWAALYRLDPKINMGAKNYSGNSLRVWDGSEWVEDTRFTMPGSERAILEYYFGSRTPEITPWEMFGFSIKPLWWDTTEDNGDGFTGYKDATFYDILLDVEQGVIRRGSRSGVDVSVKKPGISKLDISIDSIENLFNMTYDFSEWAIGDLGAVENTWTETSEYRFVQAEIMFLLQPALFGEVFWDSEAVAINGDQLVNRYTGKRQYPYNYMVHGEISDANEFVYRIGYQQYISDYIRYNKRDVTKVLGEAFRTLDVNLGYKVGGFTSKDGIRAYLESSTQLTSAGGLLIPSSNYQVLLHRGAPIDVNFYTGVIVRKVQNGYQVYGYDLLDPVFKVMPADINSPAQRITEGGTSVSFIEFEFNRTYPANTIVRYNGVFYLARVEVNAVSFNKTQWEKLPSLPVTGGVTAVYYSERSADTMEVPYGYTFNDVQSLFDFMVGLGAYQQSKGWVFDRIKDGETNDTWLNAARQTLFWLTIPRKEDESLLLSPLAEKSKLQLTHGYPENIEKLVNGVYGIVDKYGYAIPTENTLVSRNDLETTISAANEGMYGIRVVVSETEHVILFDQASEFNDVIYTPVYNTRQGRLRITLTKTQGWFGKMEASGYVISGNRILENVDNLTDRFISLYSDVTNVDNSVLTEAARNLIGYDRKEYLDRLSVTDDVQFNFYQGFVRQKGTANALVKILRSNKIADKNRLDVFEEWMVNLSDYGGNTDRVSLEILSEFDAIETDNPVYRLNYQISDRLYIEDVIVYNSVELYTSTPVLQVVGDLHPDGRPAVVKAVLGADRKISRVVVIDRGDGYVSQPAVVIDGRPNSQDSFLVITKNNVVVEDAKFDTIVDIDTNDKRKWLYGNVDVIKTGLPMVAYDEVLPSAGPVTDYESDVMIFSDLHELRGSNIVDGLLIHLAKDVSSDWDLIKVVDTGLVTEMVQGEIHLTDGAVSRSVSQFVNGLGVPQSFTYSNSLVNRISGEIKSLPLVVNNEIVTYRNGKLYDSTDKPVKTLEDGLRVMTLRSMRFSNIDDAITHSYVSTGDLVYLQENGHWEVRRVGSDDVIRSSSELVIDTTLVRHANVRYASLFTYDVPVYDPIKGVIPNFISSDIDVMSEIDPAKYTNGSQNTFDADSAYADREVGMVWLDLSSLRFKMYEISNVNGDMSNNDDLEYRRKNWAKVFPGSPVDVYEWVESTVPPKQWVGEGSPKNTSEYTVRKVYNSYIDETEVKYYFWVKNISKVNASLKNRTKSVIEISNLIRSPSAYQLRFTAPIKQCDNALSFVMHGMSTTLRRHNVTITFGYKVTDEAQVVHSDWKILSNSRFNTLPNVLWEKMVDSLVGYTKPVDIEFSGDHIAVGDLKVLPVPSRALSNFTQTGVGIRPMQTMFLDITNARINIFQSINRTLTRIRIWEERFADAYATLASVDGWKTADWFAPGFNELNTRALLQVETRFQMEHLSGLSVGDLVRVYPFDPVFGIDVYEVYIKTVDGFSLVRRQDGIIQLDAKYLLSMSSVKVNHEIRHILNTLYTMVYPYEDTGIITEVYFSALNFCATEDSDMSWAVKTSYISIVQEDRELKQLRFLQPDRLDEYLRYVEDAKPYHTKIRDVAIAYTTGDIVNIDTEDKHYFDIKILFSDFRRDQSVMYIDDMPYDHMLKSVDPSGIRIGTSADSNHNGDLRYTNHNYDVDLVTNMSNVSGTNRAMVSTVTWDNIVTKVIDGTLMTGMVGKIHNYSGLMLSDSELPFPNNGVVLLDNGSLVNEDGTQLVIGGNAIYATNSYRIVDSSGTDIVLNGRKLTFVSDGSGKIDANWSRGGELVKVGTADTFTLVQEYGEDDHVTMVEVWDDVMTPWDNTTSQFIIVQGGSTPAKPTGFPSGLDQKPGTDYTGGWTTDSHITGLDLADDEVIWVSNLRYSSKYSEPRWNTPVPYNGSNSGTQYGWDGLSKGYVKNGLVTQSQNVFAGDAIDKPTGADAYFRSYGMDVVSRYVTQAKINVVSASINRMVLSDVPENIDPSNKLVLVFGELLRLGDQLSDGSYEITNRSITSTGMLEINTMTRAFIVATQSEMPTYVMYSPGMIGIVRRTYINSTDKIVPYFDGDE